MEQEGTIIVNVFNDVFKDPELKSIIDSCFNMYDYHTRMMHGNENLGWCRTMYHSVVQQLVRGDLEYWLLYAMLRRKTNLISYPYYTKYARPNDVTGFRHVDCNLADAIASGRGVEMLQGSVLFDVEDGQNCTEALAGFHRHVPAYLEWRKDNNIDRRNGYIEGWQDDRDYPLAIRKKLGCSWKSYPCKPGQVRISHPLLPHGSTGPTTKVRRTVLPWFVVVTEDHNTMEVPEMGSYQDLATAHQALRSGPSSPSGHGNKYGGVPYAFPADLPPDFKSWISKAVHCQARYDSFPVLREIDEVLNNMNSAQLQERIQQVRAANIKMVKSNWTSIVEAEKKAYRGDPALRIPDRSFFSNKGKHPVHQQGWEHWDGQKTREDGLTKMFHGMSIKADEPHEWDALRVDTSSSSEGATSKLSSPTPGPSKGKSYAKALTGSPTNTSSRRAAGNASGAGSTGNTGGGGYRTRSTVAKEKAAGKK